MEWILGVKSGMENVWGEGEKGRGFGGTSVWRQMKRTNEGTISYR